MIPENKKIEKALFCIIPQIKIHRQNWCSNCFWQ